MTKPKPDGKLRRNFSAEELAKLNELRKIKTQWGEIARIFGTNITCVKNAFYRAKPTTRPCLQEAKPKTVKAWPAVDFKPDELEPKYS